jgi:hypothetical protein
LLSSPQKATIEQASVLCQQCLAAQNTPIGDHPAQIIGKRQGEFGLPAVSFQNLRQG